MSLTNSDKTKRMDLQGTMELVQDVARRFNSERIGNIGNQNVKQYVDSGLGGKADLVDGVVPPSQLPSYVDDIIELLTMSTTAPATCAKGDWYFNTSDSKLYKATAANTWGEVKDILQQG